MTTDDISLDDLLNLHGYQRTEGASDEAVMENIRLFGLEAVR